MNNLGESPFLDVGNPYKINDLAVRRLTQTIASDGSARNCGIGNWDGTKNLLPQMDALRFTLASDLFKQAVRRMKTVRHFF